MITQHSFSVIPEGNPLRRRYTVTADYRWDDETGQGWWVVRCDGGYVHDDLERYGEPRLFDEQTAIALAEQAAGCLKLWTQYGEMTAAEAMTAGLR